MGVDQMPRVKKFASSLLVRVTTRDKSLFDQTAELTDLSAAELSRRALRVGIRTIRKRGIIGSPEPEVVNEK
jgi:hypothetical protein